MTTLTTLHHLTAASGTGHTLGPVVGCQGGLSTEVGGAAAACSSRTAGGLHPSTALGLADAELQPVTSQPPFPGAG